MKLIRTVAELRAAVAEARGGGASVGFVPTMGAFHDGHVALMRRAREASGFVVVSLFVNPTQFNEVADLDRYPRDEARDMRLAEAAGADVLFAPSVSEMYPTGFSTTVDVAIVTEPLEGAVRGPKHFRGVATVVAKLFNMVQPDVAYFGQKDAQQVVVVRRMARDLDIPLRIEVCATVREPDGVAMSSRNALLDAESRRRATALSRALFAVESAVSHGERDAARALNAGRAILTQARIEPEYFAAVDSSTLEPVSAIERETLVAIAARFGPVRLIDNVLVSPAEAHA